MQQRLALIPYYKDSRLYEPLKEITPKFFVGIGYEGEKELVFYNTDDAGDHIKKNETGRIHFRNFKEAYTFILKNNIKNYNIDEGGYTKEIKRYIKESEQ